MLQEGTIRHLDVPLEISPTQLLNPGVGVEWSLPHQNTAERDPGHLQNWVKEGQATLVEVWCRCTGSGTILSGPEKYCLGSFHAAF